MSCIFVGNLNTNITEKILQKYFSTIGDCKIALKNSYAFIEYSTQAEASEAIKKFQNTTFDGLNKKNKVRIEFSKKKLVGNELRSNVNDDEIPLNDEVNDFEKNKNNEDNENNQNSNLQNKNNICYSCKLPGHFAKDCVLTRKICFECGEKGHLAKDCKSSSKNSDKVTKNILKAKAVLSQQRISKLCNNKHMMDNLIKYIKSNNLLKAEK